ncbi:hypothetical protein FIBSPDRAFT_754032 [Athelia psychrophila]|uniref:Zn(2)-C6 fungal-type domain-containing protein n=1 Tax=Athelia psychrophila TaxID=1759441 RepID=A0A166BXB1_9AGAM|nr:hypothetical protein FIBSPDRAFT_754032 [Fibularhizoctonia sp. CBS 109695]
MSEINSAVSSSNSRKQPRASNSGLRGLNSTEGRPPPTKRARKAINCEPCRASKLKCDRNRPCSSCVLRGMRFHEIFVRQPNGCNYF